MKRFLESKIYKACFKRVVLIQSREEKTEKNNVTFEAYCEEDSHQLSFVPTCRRTRKNILIYSEKEQVTYLENASNYKDRLEPDYQVMLEHMPRWQFQTDQTKSFCHPDALTSIFFHNGWLHSINNLEY